VTFEARTPGVVYAGPFSDSQQWRFARFYTIGKNVGCGDWIAECPGGSLVRQRLMPIEPGVAGDYHRVMPSMYHEVLPAMMPTLKLMWGVLPNCLFIDTAEFGENALPSIVLSDIATDAKAYGVQTLGCQSQGEVPTAYTWRQNQSMTVGWDWDESSRDKVIRIGNEWGNSLITEINVKGGISITGRKGQAGDLRVLRAVQVFLDEIWYPRNERGLVSLLNWAQDGAAVPFPMWVQELCDRTAGV
jgi:hypothetical protein